MICNFPSPTVLCSLGQAGIVMPLLVMEFIGTIRQSAPHQRGDRVDHYSEFIFGVLHLGNNFSNVVPRLAFWRENIGPSRDEVLDTRRRPPRDRLNVVCDAII